MTDKAQDPCRVIAEKIWEAMCKEDPYEHSLETMTDAIRNHTVVPEMVSMLENIEATHLNTILGALIHKLLVKAKGRSDD